MVWRRGSQIRTSALNHHCANPEEQGSFGFIIKLNEFFFTKLIKKLELTTFATLDMKKRPLSPVLCQFRLPVSTCSFGYAISSQPLVAIYLRVIFDCIRIDYEKHVFFSSLDFKLFVIHRKIKTTK